jgi:hypothetical protein
MKPTPVQIVDVVSASYGAAGLVELIVVIEGERDDVLHAAGSAVQHGDFYRATVPYTWDPGEGYDNSGNVWLWFMEHPDFVIEPYVAPPVTVEMVKAEAARRIGETIPRWMFEREFTGGTPISQEQKDAVELIRHKSNDLEALSPIPQDFTDDKYWS